VKRSYLEQQFMGRWVVRCPDLPFEREVALPAWRSWAEHKKATGMVRRAVPMRADFAWSPARVALEIQGGTWVKGGHSSGAGIERDAIKALLAQADGWALVALTDHMLCRHGHIWLPRLEQLIRSRIAVATHD
jgi:hypothetical protein